jgi:hypothetical protein
MNNKLRIALIYTIYLLVTRELTPTSMRETVNYIGLFDYFVFFIWGIYAKFKKQP